MLSNHRHLPAKVVFFTSASLLFLAACQATPEPSDVQTAIAETQIALEGPSHPLKPSETPTITPTLPTATPTLVPTETITPGPSPTIDPLELIYTGSPAGLQCEKGDLPADYYWFNEPENDLYGQHTNTQVITEHPNPDQAQRYVIETQRTDGWWKIYLLNEENDNVPVRVFCQTTTFANHIGALLSIRWPLWDEILNYRYLDPQQIIGQDHVVIYRQITDSEGRQLGLYRILFVYQNLVGTVQTYEPVGSASPDFAYQIAQRLLARYQAVQLTDPRFAPSATTTLEVTP